ncbi:hypothetical protein Tco_0333147 [Tanacetum coccineum]
MPPKKTTTPMIDVTIKELIAQGVADDLAEYEANRNSGNGDDSHDSGSGIRRTEHTTRECTYSDFLKCQPLNFKGTEGVESLIWWSNNVGVDFLTSYQVSVTASKPQTMPRSHKIAKEPNGPKIHTFAEKQAENKRRLDNNSSDNNSTQAPFKRQKVAKSLILARPMRRRSLAGTLLLCNKFPAATYNQRTLTCYEFGNQERRKPIKTPTTWKMISMLNGKSSRLA